MMSNIKHVIAALSIQNVKSSCRKTIIYPLTFSQLVRKRSLFCTVKLKLHLRTTQRSSHPQPPTMFVYLKLGVLALLSIECLLIPISYTSLQLIYIDYKSGTTNQCKKVRRIHHCFHSPFVKAPGNYFNCTFDINKSKNLLTSFNVQSYYLIFYLNN